MPATDQVPERFELGTLPYELMAGTTAAVDFLASWGEGEDRRARIRDAFAAIEAYEDALRERLEEGLSRLPVVLHSRAARRTPTLLLTFPDADAAEVSEALADARHQRADRATSTPGSLRITSVWAPTVGCGSGWRRTRPRRTSTGCWSRWGSFCLVS